MKTWYKYKVFIVDMKAKLIRFGTLLSNTQKYMMWYKYTFIQNQSRGKQKFQKVPIVRVQLWIIRPHIFRAKILKIYQNLIQNNFWQSVSMVKVLAYTGAGDLNFAKLR